MFLVASFVFVGQILKEIVVEDARIMLQNGDVDAFPVKNAVHRGSLGVGRLCEFLDRDLLFSQYLPDVFSYVHNFIVVVVEVSVWSLFCFRGCVIPCRNHTSAALQVRKPVLRAKKNEERYVVRRHTSLRCMFIVIC